MKQLHSHRIAALVACALAGPVLAQSSVTVSGVADAAARWSRSENVGSDKLVASGANSTSRLIFRGTEDLGGGLSAGFHLEHGLLLDSGSAAQATQFWDRRSTVSLASKSLGELRIGRDFVPSYVGWSRYDPFSYVGVGSSSNFVSSRPQGPIRSAFASNPNSTVRSNNAVQVLLPGGLGGVEGGLLVALPSGNLAANGQHRVRGARLGYVAGPLNLSLAYTRSDNDLTTATGAFKDVSLGGAYDFGLARVSLALRRFEHADARQQNTLLGVWIPAGSAGEVKLSYQRANLSGKVGAAVIDANDASQLALGYVHNLSKRTALYTTYSRIGNSGAATYSVPGSPAGLAGGDGSSGLDLGIRHTF